MGAVIDDARAAGFSEAEIAAWADSQRDTWRGAGFSDQEIDRHVTGMKEPHAAPWALLERFHGDDPSRAVAIADKNVGNRATAAAQTMMQPIDEAFRFGEPGIGSDERGNPSTGFKALDRLLGGGGLERFQTWPERMVRSGFTLAHDVVAGEVMIDPRIRREDVTDKPRPGGPTEDSTWLGRALGLPPVAWEPFDTAAERAMDLGGFQLATTAFNRVATASVVAGRQSPIRRGAPGADETIGHLPTAQDFTDAAKAVAGGEFDSAIRQRVVDLYESRGIHPAEVAHDAISDPNVGQSLRAGEVPSRYARPEPAPPPPEPVRPTDLASERPANLDDARIAKIISEIEPFRPQELAVPGGKPANENARLPSEDQVFEILRAARDGRDPAEAHPRMLRANEEQIARLKEIAAGKGDEELREIAKGVARPPQSEPARPNPYDAVSPDGIPTERYTAPRDEARARAGEPIGDEMPGPRPGGLGAPDTPPSRAPYFRYDDRSAIERTFTSVVDGYKRTFQPELVSDRALTADPLFAQYKSMQSQARDSAIARAEDHYQFWRRVPEAERLDYLDRMERGRPAAAGLEDRAARHQEMLKKAYEMEAEFGSKADYVTNYFPHIWQDPLRARAFVEARSSQVGPTWFQNERTFSFIQEGLEAGLRLKTSNPEQLVTLRLLASADMVERMRLLQGLKDMGLATEAKGAPGSMAREGWAPITAPSRDPWLLAPDVQPLWKNAVEARGLWANEGMVGTAFRGWMAVKNVWVPIKLALSAFHPLHVLHINYTEGFARAWDQVVKGGDLVGALKSTAEGLYGPVQAAIPGVPFSGKLAREAWLLPEGERTPWQRAAIDLMHDGGFVPQLSEELKINAKRSLESAWDNSEWFKALPALIRRGIEVAQAPVFQEWIPNLKAAAYLNEAQALLARSPELLDNAVQRGVALRTISKSIDNRYGEMNYGGLFWNRYVKDAGIGSFLSLGWNLGFVREFGGALLQPEIHTIRRLAGRETETQATIRMAQNKVAYVTAYAGSAMLLAGAMTYLFTGEMPEGMDYFFPRIGGTNPDGSPRRVTTMFYTREIPMAMKHVQEHGGNLPAGLGDMLWNKLMFQPFKELWDNRSYYGNDIWSTNAPFYKQAVQGISHVFGEQLSPMSITGARRSQQTGGEPWEAGLAILGFGPAPAYAEKSGTQNRIAYLFRRHVAPFARPEEMGEKSRERALIRNDLLRAMQDGNQEAITVAEQKWRTSGGSAQGLANIRQGLTGDMTMFRALPSADQQAIMEQATMAERLRYAPFLKRSVTERTADLIAAAQRARNAGDTATEQATNRRLRSTITRARNDGTITDIGAFRNDVATEVIKRYGKELPGLLGAPSPSTAPPAPP
jgi:hypothetical protein